jgi:inosine-uridine nucleoside N-ribohydrolase
MKLSDILPLEKGVELEQEIHTKSGLNASVLDADGARIVDFQKWANKLCPMVKSNKNEQSVICEVTPLNSLDQAKRMRKHELKNVIRSLSKWRFLYFWAQNF